MHFSKVYIVFLTHIVHGFRIGKIHEVNTMNLHVHLFFYQLDDKKSEIIFERDLLINFGRIGTKKKLHLTEQQLLLEKLFQIGMNIFKIKNKTNHSTIETNSSSLLQIVGESQFNDYNLN